MGNPINYHSTAAEIAFMQQLGPRGRMSRLQVLEGYRATLEKRVEWGQIDRHELIRATEREIAAEVKKVRRRAA